MMTAAADAKYTSRRDSGTRGVNRSASQTPRPLAAWLRTRFGSLSDRLEEVLHHPRREGAERFIKKDGLVHFLAHHGEAAGKFLVLRQRLLDLVGVAAVQRAGCMP